MSIKRPTSNFQRSTFRVQRWTFIQFAIQVFAIILLSAPAFALQPDQIVLLVAKDNKDSHEIADHYIKARNIPPDHIIEILGGEGGADPAYFRTTTIPLIRQTLIDRKLDKTVTCLVTTFGIPLAIGPTVPTPAEKEEITTLRHELVNAIEDLKTAIEAYQGILAPTPATTQAASMPDTTHDRAPEIPPLPELDRRLNLAVDDAIKRIHAASSPARETAMKDFMQLHERVVGLAGIMPFVRISADAPNAADAQKYWDNVSKNIKDADDRYEALSHTRDNFDSRREMIDLRRRFHGLAGAIGEIQSQIAILQGDQSESAFDNELMMLWIDGYPRTRWLANPMEITRWPYDPHKDQLPRVMMVSRLDGLTPAAVNAMVDQSIKTEAAGLDGVVYFDARGLHQMDDYSQFDADIRAAAAYLHDNTDMKVVLDDKPQLLRAADCPNAALYCGWYSVHNYQDSCQWLPGSVAYHVASFELTTLHDPADKGWCINLLKRGVCGTLGPTNEPFLFAFPKPSLFFPLLVSGLFTQAEVFYITVPNTSWRIAYVGDPLYNPFKNKPRLSIDKLRAHPILRNALVEMGIDSAPATIPQPGKAQ